MNKNRQKAIYIYWIALKLFEKVFANDADVDSNFNVAYNHLFLATANTIAILSLYLTSKTWGAQIALSKFIVIQFTLYSYYMLTVLWSPMTLVTLGQAIYSYYGLIFAIIIAKSCINEKSNLEKIVQALSLWRWLIIIDYIISFVFNLIQKDLSLPSVDEKSLIAISIALLSISASKKFATGKNLPLYWVYIMGQSFSAIIASLLVLAKYLLINTTRFIGYSLVLIIFGAVPVLIYLTETGYITIYGKSIEFLQSGSGRFAVWEYLYNEYLSFDIARIVFGNGYMSEREFLSNLDLPWAIDAHSNILQALYGTGLIGTFIMMLLWAYPFLRIKRNIINHNHTLKKITQIMAAAHLSFIFFGLTSSHYFSRPSVSAIFITSMLLILKTNNKFVKLRYT